MIYGNLKDLQGRYAMHGLLTRALDYLAGTDFDSLDFGVYQPDPDFLVQVIDMETRPVSTNRAEVHRRNIDIHLSLKGDETVYYRSRSGGLSLDEDLFDSRDIGFYSDVDGEVELPLSVGDFVVFFPGEVHRPGCLKGREARIKKIVLKIEIGKFT